MQNPRMLGETCSNKGKIVYAHKRGQQLFD